jgi:hypothetical protein
VSIRYAVSVMALAVFMAANASAQRPRLGAAGFRGGAGFHQNRTPRARTAAASLASRFREISSESNWRGYRVHPGWRYGIGYSLYNFGGYGGYGFPYFDYPAYNTVPDECNPAFFLPAFYCQPPYAQVPQNGWEAWQGGAMEPSDSRREEDPFPSRSQEDISVGPAPISWQDRRAKVQLKLDGHLLPEGGVLTVTSGEHQLSVNPSPEK